MRGLGSYFNGSNKSHGMFFSEKLHSVDDVVFAAVKHGEGFRSVDGFSRGRHAEGVHDGFVVCSDSSSLHCGIVL